MAHAQRLTKSQQQRFYREAVERTLISLYHQPEAVSKTIVSAWWERVFQTQEFQAGLFFHAEPLHTAADIAHLESVAITSKNEETYLNVLLHARNQALHTSGQAALQSRELQKPLTEPSTKKQQAKKRFQPILQQQEANKQAQQKLIAKR